MSETSHAPAASRANLRWRLLFSNHTQNPAFLPGPASRPSRGGKPYSPSVSPAGGGAARKAFDRPQRVGKAAESGIRRIWFLFLSSSWLHAEAHFCTSPRPYFSASHLFSRTMLQEKGLDKDDRLASLQLCTRCFGGLTSPSGVLFA